MLTASFPSPSSSALHLGPLTVRAYALCIIVGIVVAVLIAERRLRARGFPEGSATEIATWGVPLGLIGARVYHVITTPDPYFGKGGKPLDAFAIWHGGLGIWGGVLGGMLGGYIAVRRMNQPFLIGADACAPAIAVAQAIGRWGNYFNQELYGRASNVPWAVRIDPEHRTDPLQATYQPTFLYECIWDLGVAGVCIWADRRFKLGAGRVLALYVALYTAGRAWIEALRVDEAHHFLGIRLNDYVSGFFFLAAVLFLVVRRGRTDGNPAALGPVTVEGERVDRNSTGNDAVEENEQPATREG